jgi:hypothetical protein
VTGAGRVPEKAVCCRRGTPSVEIVTVIVARTTTDLNRRFSGAVVTLLVVTQNVLTETVLHIFALLRF